MQWSHVFGIRDFPLPLYEKRCHRGWEMYVCNSNNQWRLKNDFLDIKGKIFNKSVFWNISLNENKKKKQIDNDYLDAFYILDKIRIIIIIIYLYLRYFWWILYFRNYFISVWHLASKIFLNYVLGILLKSCYFKNNTR